MKTFCLFVLLLSASCAPVRVSQPKLDWRKTLQPSCWPREQVQEGDETFFATDGSPDNTHLVWHWER